jgi:hypothetical protein
MDQSNSSLDTLELLREFKRRAPQIRPDVNITPFDERVRTAQGTSEAADVNEIHAEVRSHIRELIEAVRDGAKQSQVILLSGAAGVGKTHLLRTFQTPEAMAKSGHVFVGGSNHWKIEEFPAYLLDRILVALADPSPEDEHHLLFQRVQNIGFRTVEHLLTNPVSLKRCLARRSRSFFRRLFNFRRSVGYDELKEMTERRDLRVFRYLDFAPFSAYACDRFLAERANLLHRYALRVLLLYLFPETPETGVGTREQVLHWFRGRGGDPYFLRRLGTEERPDRVFTQIEAIKLLSHLFSKTVSAELSTDRFPCPPQVLLLTFDQVEGRNELFENDGDWKDFFAHLSELYNTLPNIVVLFTMTLGLKNRLHALMERQFRDRIRMDEKFTLNPPTSKQVLALYRSRVERWLGNDPDLVPRYRNTENPYLPFTVGELNRPFASTRDALDYLDREFRKKLAEVPVDASIDYLYERNELKPYESKEYEYTSAHLETLKRLLDAVGSFLTKEAGIEIRETNSFHLDNVPVMKFVFGIPGQTQTVTFHLARLGKHYNEPIANLIKAVLYDREKAKNFLFVIRPQPLPDPLDVVQPHYKSQFFADICPSVIESGFACLLKVEAKHPNYNPQEREGLDVLIRTEVGTTYLRRFLKLVRQKLEALDAAKVGT